MPYFTLGRRKVWISLPKSPLHPYVILPCTFRQRKWAEVLPERVVLHPRATKRRDSVAQACRATSSGNENGRRCCPSVSCCTLGRRIVWVSLPKSPPYSYVILSRTFGQRKWMEVLPERVVLHPRATKSVGFVAEESPLFLRHSVSHLWATKMLGSVTQACRAAPSGDEKCGFRCRRVPFILTSFCLAPFGNENGLKCRLKVSYCTLGRRKCSEVSPKRAALHPRATKSVGFVAEESPFILTSFCPTPTGNKNGRKCRLNVSCRTLGRRRSAEVSPERAVLHSWVTILG